MRKIVFGILLCGLLTIAACGEETVPTNIVDTKPVETVKESISQSEESSEEVKNQEDEEWGAPYYANTFDVVGKTNVEVHYNAAFPSLHPVSKGDIAYQKDAALCRIGECNSVLDDFAGVTSMQDYFDVEIGVRLAKKMVAYRGGRSKNEDYQFTITSQEDCVITNKEGTSLNAIRVSGTHHWTEVKKHGEESPEYDEPFCGYVIDLGTEELAFVSVWVFDDSIMTKEGQDDRKLQPGQIEEYALKMAESICPYKPAN